LHIDRAFKPLLAHTIEDTSKLEYPVLASCKLDGIRCVVIDGVALSRSLKPIRNTYVQKCIGRPEYNGLDGELIVGDIFAEDCYRATSSGVMSADGEPDFKFHVFDQTDLPNHHFEARFDDMEARFGIEEDHPHLCIVNHYWVGSENELLAIETELLERGAEGVMVRSPAGLYKQGRSTAKEGILGKLKRFQDAEYKIVGFEERMHNANPATKNALGETERSTHQENLVPRGDLGSIVVELSPGVTFNCGSGFNDAQRREMWDNRLDYLGKYAKIKSFAIGVKDLPRFPIFQGIRFEEDK